MPRGVREEALSILDKTFATDDEIHRAAAEANLDFDDLRRVFVSKLPDVINAVEFETKRLRDLQARFDELQRRTRYHKYFPPGPVRVASYVAICAGALTTILVGVLLAGEVFTWGGPFNRLLPVEPEEQLVLPGAGLAVVVIALGTREMLVWWFKRSYERAAKSTKYLMLQEEVAAVEEVWRRALEEKGVKGTLFEIINQQRPSYSAELEVRAASGLAELRDPVYYVKTAAEVQIEKLLELMPGGSIGVSGARGAGKTTLLRRFCYLQDDALGRTSASSVEPGQAGPLGVLVSAPVRYDAREFILHLFSKVCESLLTPEERPDLRTHRQDDRNVPDTFRLTLTTLLPWIVLYGIILLLGVVLDWTVNPALEKGLLLISVGLAAIRATFAVRRFTPSSNLDRSWLIAVGDDPLKISAGELLIGLAYQQSFAQAWSAAAKLPVGIEGGVSASATMTEHPMSFPEVVSRFETFLRQVSRRRSVFIGIDELDKIEDGDDARRFLNDIKAVFGIEGCYFLVSVSEDAMSAFDRRGLPLRDAFDSALDVVVRVEHLDLSASKRLLQRRTLGLPVGFICLCHVMAGGVPRDVIRFARDVITAAQNASASGRSIAALSRQLVAMDLKRKHAASVLAARKLAREPELGSFLAEVSTATQAWSGESSEVNLLSACQALSKPRRWTGGPSDGQVDELRSLVELQVETASYYYFSATVVAFFGDGLSAERLREAEEATDNGGIYQLALARQSFESSAAVAWHIVSGFRRKWKMRELEFPKSVYDGFVTSPGGSAVEPPPGCQL